MNQPVLLRWPAFVLAILLPMVTLAQVHTNGCYSDIRKAILYPELVGCLEVSASGNEALHLVAHLHKMVNLTQLTLQGEWNNDNGQKLIEELAQHTRLEKLCLEDNQLVKPPQGLEKLQGLREIVIVGNSNLHFKQLVAQLAKLPHLESVFLEENDLRQLPSNFSELSRLQRVYIKGNDALNFEKAIEELAELPRLTEIHLPINQITDLPANIGKLSHLRVLDLRDNVLTGLNENMVSLKDLDTLQIEGNIIVEPLHELSKARGLAIRYLSLDHGLSSEEMEIIQALFPQATIVEDKPGTVPPDTLLQLPVKTAMPTVIRIEGEELRVLSKAYLHYARLFNQRQFVYDFDSSLFEERYLDTNFANVWKRQPELEYKSIALEGYRWGNRKEVWFDFKRSGESAWNVHLHTNNPEVNAFMGMKWVYVGPLKSREFRKKYLRKNYWTDVRIYYNEAVDNFTIELKHASGFDRITAVPRNYDKSLPLEKSQRLYARRYERYQKVLQRRGERFHQQQQRDQVHYNLAYQERIDKAWKAFRETYFSEEEKAMTRQQWFAYYDQVIAREKEALGNAKADRISLLRRLEIEGYSLVSESSDEFWVGVNRVECAFAYEDSTRIPETTILVIDENQQQLRLFEGNLGISAITTYIGDATGCSIIVIARNGDIGLLNSQQMVNNDLLESGCHTFYLQRFQRELVSVGDLWKALGWHL